MCDLGFPHVLSIQFQNNNRQQVNKHKWSANLAHDLISGQHWRTAVAAEQPPEQPTERLVVAPEWNLT